MAAAFMAAASAVTDSPIAASIGDFAAEALHSGDPRDGVGTAVRIGGR
jgi:hypothetical protein